MEELKDKWEIEENWTEEDRNPHNKVIIVNQALRVTQLDHKQFQKSCSVLIYTRAVLQSGAQSTTWRWAAAEPCPARMCMPLLKRFELVRIPQ